MDEILGSDVNNVKRLKFVQGGILQYLVVNDQEFSLNPIIEILYLTLLNVKLCNNFQTFNHRPLMFYDIIFGGNLQLNKSLASLVFA